MHLQSSQRYITPDRPCERLTIPAESESPGLVDEAHVVGEEGAVDRVHDAQLSKSLHCEQQHYANDRETDHKRCWASIGKRFARPNEETSANRATCTMSVTLSARKVVALMDVCMHTDGNHLHVPPLERSLELVALDG